MKLFTLALVLLAFCAGAFADQTVRGYTRRDGTYVAPHMRSDPNQYRYDNYSSQGNVNPYTGRRGTQPNEFSTPPVYNRSNPASGYTTPRSYDPYGQPRQRSRY